MIPLPTVLGTGVEGLELMISGGVPSFGSSCQWVLDLHYKSTPQMLRHKPDRGDN